MTITYRKATLDDSKFLFDLKNDDDVRKFSIKTHDKIEWESHLIWLKENLDYILIFEFNNVPCGDVRIKDDEIAIKIQPQFRGLGIADKMITVALSQTTFIIAKIVDGNVPSMNLFLKHGFKIVDHKDNYYILHHGEKK